MSDDNPLGVDHVVGLDETGGPLEPWLVRDAITMIDEHLKSLRGEARVFEFGSGSSTPWLNERAKQVFSVEHFAPWVAKQAQYYNSVELDFMILCCPIRGRKYVEAARLVAPPGGYDLILVDGRRRVECIQYSYNLLRSGGLFVLDNSERERYQIAVDRLDAEGWERHDFKNSMWQTTVWRRP